MTTSMFVIAILVLYAGAMLVIGRFAKRRIKSFQDTISAPGQTSLLLLMGSAIGTHIGSGFVVGGAEYGAIYGIGGAWYGIGCGLSYIVVGALLCKFVYRHQYVSLADYLGKRYDGTATRLIYSLANALSCIATLAGQLLAGRAIFLTLGLSETWGVVLTAVISLVYANAAGLWGTIAVSTIQSSIIFVGMAAAIVVMLFKPEAGALLQSLPADYFKPVPFDPEFLVELVLPLTFASLVYQGAYQTIVSAKTEKTAVRGYTFAGLCLIPIALIPPLLGMFGRAIFPSMPSAEVFMELLLTQLPTAVAAIILAAIVCSVIGACNGAYIAVAANLVHDIYQGMLAPQADSKTCKRLMLAADVAVCLIGILLALRMNDIIQLLAMGYSLLAAGCLVPFAGGLAWKRGTTKGALCSSFVGMAASLGSSMGLFHLPYTSITSILLSAAAFVAGSLLLGPDSQKQS